MRKCIIMRDMKVIMQTTMSERREIVHNNMDAPYVRNVECPEAAVGPLGLDEDETRHEHLVVLQS